ncbi:thiamine phosphate synthase [Anaerobutyricum soehngenii]|uniref:thiamine phosphate synthase n=1 Tax=Anaerobutyricum soehngenii TaxID=105843 RepID=UPI001C10B096|nr:thiamine phosphate synthase [Anaerobutyricum soehngenii]MBU5416559.1 thiamine phosphate synthase [Anaerobutyricum soehngenii]
MSDLICITNRKLCSNNFSDQIEMIASAHPKAIVLREKDLSEKEYEQLARQVMQICQKHGTQCILHSFSNVATALGATAVHMPLPLLQKMTPQEKSHFQIIGASCHSLEEAKEAQNLGCTYITAGHIFLTDCKKGLPGRGLPFLEEICKTVRIPVYAIGGISSQNMESVRKTGAAGACIMSGFMRCKTVEEIM